MLSELKYAVRSLAKTPWLTAVVVITLALGIAANTAVFSWTRGVLLNPLHGVADARRLVSLEAVYPNREYTNSSYPDFRDYRDSSRSLAGTIAYKFGPLSFGNENQAERVWAEFVSGNFFDVLGVRPAAGRFFRTEEQEEAPGKYPVAVISARFWRLHFHADPQIVGKTIRVNRQELTVVGVAPTEFLGTVVGLSFDLWVPLAMDPVLNDTENWFENRGDRRGLRLLARLRPAVSLPEARTEIQTIARRLAHSYPKSNADIGATLLPIDQADQGVQSLIGTLLKTLLGAGAVLLLIVCANVANLMLVRATARQKEFSIRLALGASRGRVIGQLLLESFLLAGLGGLAGVLLAGQMASWLRFFIPAEHLPLALDFPPDSAVLLFTLSISVLVGLLFGLAPALQTIRDDQLSGLKDSGRGSVGSSRSHRLRGILVVSEVALALVVLIGASLFVESFRHAKQSDPGFDPSHVLLAPLNLAEAGYSIEQGTLFMRHLRDRIEALPGVRAVSFADNVPLGFGDDPLEDVQVGGYVPRRGEDMRVHWNPIWSAYFDLMRIALIEGRDFTERDDSESPHVAIINEAFAQRFFRGQEPVGRQLDLWGQGSGWTVVGVVKDIKYRSPGETPRPHFYLPIQQAWEPFRGLELHVRTVGPPLQLLPELRRELRSVDPRVHLFEVYTLSDYIGEAWFAQKIGAALLGVLGTLALLLAALGLFSVMAYTVSRRTQEIGIRMALGAQTLDVLRPVLGQALRLAMVGVGVGLALSLALTRLVASQLLGVSATDPLTFVGVSCLLCAVALAASIVPARRATRVDPLIALRAE
ncbi:MAG TPA: ABC transporter permease [Steroidobacteraceae bacterium]|jgi:predicted permease